MNQWWLECARCGRTDIPTDKPLTACPHCGHDWLEPRFPYEKLKPILLEEVPKRRCTMWRYREFLPITYDENIISMGEGGTPLIRLRNLGLMFGAPNLYVKDERQGPTGSFKDRQASLAISLMKEHNIREAVVASTGNVAISYSAYAAQAGIKLWAFLTSSVPADKMREVALYGTEVVKVTATYDRTKEVAAQFAEHRGLHLDRGIRSVAARESMKTLAYEIAEDFGWRAPDWYVQAVSGGMGPVGVLKGFQELYRMGLIDKIPKIAAVQATGCAPMVKAWQENSSVPINVESPQTLITTVATGKPGIAYTILYHAAKRYGGTFVAVTDEEAFRTMHIMAKLDGFSMEPAAAMAFAGTMQLLREGVIKPDETVVICLSGHTFPVEKHLLEEGWAHDLDLSHEEETSHTVPNREEGLLASLENLGGDVRRIVIVEDDAPARVLLRRILQARGEYEIYEAENGRRGLEVIKQVRPDLILLDLMMPEMDGYQVLDHLKADETLENIPVIVITAAHLTESERKRLSGYVRSLLRKGEFIDTELMDDIESALK